MEQFFSLQTCLLCPEYDASSLEHFDVTVIDDCLQKLIKEDWLHAGKKKGNLFHFISSKRKSDVKKLY